MPKKATKEELQEFLESLEENLDNHLLELYQGKFDKVKGNIESLKQLLKIED